MAKANASTPTAATADAASTLQEVLTKQAELQAQMAELQEKAKASIVELDAAAAPFNTRIQAEVDSFNEFAAGYKPLIDDAKKVRDEALAAITATFKAATDEAYAEMDARRTATESAVEAIRAEAVEAMGEAVLVVLKGTKQAKPVRSKSGQSTGHKRVSLDLVGERTVSITAPKDTGKPEPISVTYSVHRNDNGDMVITGTRGDVSHTGSITKAARYAGWHSPADVAWALAQHAGLDLPELQPSNDPSSITISEVAG